MSGSPLGFGIETQARDEAMGLNSARGRIRIRVFGIMVGVSMVCVLDEVCDEVKMIIAGHFVFDKIFEIGGWWTVHQAEYL
jgi:hypothetical protein